MDLNIETKVIKTFFYKHKQGRLLFELTSNRRQEFIHKLCHRFEEFFKPEVVYQKSRQFPELNALCYTMREFGVSNKCYVFSEYEDFDGIYTNLETAAERLNCNGFASLMVGLPSGFTHFKAESDRSLQINFYLKPPRRFDGLPWDKGR